MGSTINGKRIFEYSYDSWFFKNVSVVDIPCTGGELISVSYIKDKMINNDIDLLLIRTGLESYRKEDYYWNNNSGLSSDLADYLRLNYPKLRYVGFDFLSLTSWKHRNEGRIAHKNFLCPNDNSRELLVIEDMSLKDIEEVISETIVSPLLVEDGNGAFVTVFS